MAHQADGTAPLRGGSVGLYVQYGCGHSAGEGWLNFDSSPTLLWEKLPILGRWSPNGAHFPPSVRFGNIVRGLPLPAGSCRGVYASHVLEHLTLSDFRRALRNTLWLLEPGGVFRLVVPDLEVYARRYVEDGDGLRFVRDMNLGRVGVGGGGENAAKALITRLRGILGTSPHLWMWDYRGLSRELEEAGFTGIRRCEFGDAEDGMFARVEEASRFVDAVGVEARR